MEIQVCDCMSNVSGISLDLNLPRNFDIGFSTVAPCFLWSPSLKHEICKWRVYQACREFVMNVPLGTGGDCSSYSTIGRVRFSAVQKGSAAGDIDIDCKSSISIFGDPAIPAISPSALRHHWCCNAVGRKPQVKACWVCMGRPWDTMGFLRMLLLSPIYVGSLS